MVVNSCVPVRSTYAAEMGKTKTGKPAQSARKAGVLVGKAGKVDSLRAQARAAMAEGKVVVLSGGTGNPFFTTDTAACLRGVELGVDAVLKATNVDGVYSADPKQDPQAQKYDEITYDEVLHRELGVMDLTAIVLCKENALPLVVFDLQAPGALVALANGGTVGTRVIAAGS